MKNLFTLFAIVISAIFMAQAPNLLSYQAVVRNAANQLVINQNVGIKFSILKSSATGTVVYTETQNSTTNSNGLFTTNIGSGTVISGSMASINWANDVYFIKSEIDLAGGSNYTITGTQQLLSVPYALNAKNGIPNGGTANQVLAKVDGTDYNTQWVTPSDSDNLGNHTATTALNMNSNAITGVTNITATGTATLGGNTYPTNTGTSGQVLTTNGAGALSWGTVAGGPQTILRATATTAQTFPIASSLVTPDIATCFNNEITDTFNAFTNGVFTAPSTGLYFVSIQTTTGSTIALAPMVDVGNNGNNGGEDFCGTYISNNNFQLPSKGRGQLQCMIYLTSGQTFSVRFFNQSNGATMTNNTDGSTNITIVKLN